MTVRLIETAKMNNLNVKTTNIQPFSPQTFGRQQAKLEALIDYAAKVNDLDLLLEAVEAKLDDQQAFVDWWSETVTVRQAAGGNRFKTHADLRSSTSCAIAEQQTGIKQQQVSRWRGNLKDRDAYRDKILCAAGYGVEDYGTADVDTNDTTASTDSSSSGTSRGDTNQNTSDTTAATNHRALGTGINEWFTPRKYVDAARKVMHVIDLDPASHKQAQKTVKAESYFTKETDGLAHTWSGKVWLNPPYAKPLLANFVEKTIAEYESGRVTEAIVLTHSYTDTAWFHQLATVTDRFCFTRGRVGFVNTQGNPCNATQGQVFFYLGNNADTFARIFREFGAILGYI